jgi:hypothetical protein
MPAEAPSRCLELRPKLSSVINLAIIRNNEAAAGGTHRLRPGRRKFNNRKAAMAEREPSASIGEDCAVVWTAMTQCVSHRLGHGGNRRRRTLPSPIPDARDAAHLSDPLSGPFVA